MNLRFRLPLRCAMMFGGLLLFGIITELPAQVIETTSGPVEFIGLEYRTPEQVWDTVLSLYPQGSDPHACASVLRMQLGYPDAAVFALPDSASPTGMYWVVMLVEPENAGRVRFAPVPLKSGGAVERFAGLDSALAVSPYAVNLLGDTYRYVVAGDRQVALQRLKQQLEMYTQYIDGFDVGSSDIERAWDVMAGLTTEQDLDLAINVLQTDSSTSRRITAAIVLMNFPDHPRAWHAAVAALRDSVQQVAMQADAALQHYMTGEPPQIDWAQSVPTIQMILDGTNLYALETVLQMMDHTNIEPSEAARILEGHTGLLFSMLASRHPVFRQIAHDFLMSVSGSDHGTDERVWKSWITKTASETQR